MRISAGNPGPTRQTILKGADRMKRLNRFRTILLILLILSLSAALPAVRAGAADTASTAGIVSTAWGSLNVRSAPGTYGSIVTSLPKGTYVTLMDGAGAWRRVEYATDQYGYVSAPYIQSVTGSRAAGVTAYYLNVRTGAGASYAVKSVLRGGETVVVLSAGSGWCRVLYHGTQTGYVGAKYLSYSGSGMTWPVPASKTINQYFYAGSHLGIDIGSSVHGVAGDAVVAACSGTVVYTGWLSGYGNVVYINSVCDGQWIQTRYAHLSAISVSAGDAVSAGRQIGLMGSTGTSTGVHLHFEVRLRSTSAECLANSASTADDPMNYLAY
jgi:murein DD-endopeptidase MepM/ murein hydrolase activator NlpD